MDNPRKVAGAGRPIDPISKQDAIKLPGIELGQRRHETGEAPLLAYRQELRADERTDPNRKLIRDLTREEHASPRARNPPREGDAQLRQQPERMAVAIECVRTQVPMNPITHLGRGPATQVACFFEYDDLSARPRDQRSRAKASQSASDDDQIRLPATSYRRFHD